MHDASGFWSFVLVRSKTSSVATVRLQSDPILHGLQQMPGVQVRVHVPGPERPLRLEEPACLVFHYNDREAVQAIRAVADDPHRALTVCIGSDVYVYAWYTALHDLADLYVMPTDIHRQVLACQVRRPVHVMPECIDPIALGPDSAAFPERRGRRLLWFGYSESFYKSMSSVIPVIQERVADKSLDGFGLIVNEEGFANNYGFPTLPYDNATFRTHASRFDYAILSHFPLDLHLNSFIKSPNKAITALLAGLIPLASDTPNYRLLLERHGLQRFLFGSPGELDALLRRLDPVADSRAVQESGILPALLEEGSEERVFQRFLAILAGHRQGGAPARIAPPPLLADNEPPPRTLPQRLAGRLSRLMGGMRGRR